MKSFLLPIAFLCLALCNTFAAGKDEYEARITELKKLRAAKKITEVEYQKLSMEALVSYGASESLQATPTPAAVTASPVPRISQKDPGLSTPSKAAEASQSDLRSRLTELEKLRTDKLITDEEYQEMRKTALQAYTQGSGATSGATRAGSATTTSAAGETLDLSTPLKAAEAFQRAWNAKDIEALKQIQGAEMRKDFSAAPPERINEVLARATISKLGGVVQEPAMKEGKEQCKVQITWKGAAEDTGHEETEEIDLTKEGAEWRVTHL
jgi:hypothetical protein